MNEKDIAEQAYKNGYEQGRKDTAEKFAERAKESAEIKALAIVRDGKLYPIYKAIVNKIDEICKEITEGVK